MVKFCKWLKYGALALRLRVFAVQSFFTLNFRCGGLRDWDWVEDFWTAKERSSPRRNWFFEFFTFSYLASWRWKFFHISSSVPLRAIRGSTSVFGLNEKENHGWTQMHTDKTGIRRGYRSCFSIRVHPWFKFLPPIHPGFRRRNHEKHERKTWVAGDSFSSFQFRVFGVFRGWNFGFLVHWNFDHGGHGFRILQTGLKIDFITLSFSWNLVFFRGRNFGFRN